MTDRIGGPKGPMVPQLPSAKIEGAKAAAEQVKVERATPDEGATSGGVGERFEKVQLGRMQELLGGASLQVGGIDEGKPGASSEGGFKMVDPAAVKWSRGADLAPAVKWPESAPTVGALANKAFEGFAKMEGMAKGSETAPTVGALANKAFEGFAKVEGMAKGSEVALTVGAVANKAFEGLSKIEGAAKGIQGEAASKHSPGALDLEGPVK